MMTLVLNITLAVYVNEAWCRKSSGLYSRFIRDHNKSKDSEYYDTSKSVEDDSYEITGYATYVEDNRSYNVSADEYYVEAIREAFEMLGEHQQKITMVLEQLDQASEKKEDFQKLRELLLSTNNLIVRNIDVLKWKFGLEFTPGDMTEPVEKLTVETLLRTWKEVKPSLDELKSNEKIEELKKWLENVDHETRTKYDILESLMAKIKTMLSSSRERKQP